MKTRRITACVLVGLAVPFIAFDLLVLMLYVFFAWVPRDAANRLAAAGLAAITLSVLAYLLWEHDEPV